MKEIKYLILGSGVSGLSASYHLGHEDCLILEKEAHSYGLIHSYKSNGFTWDLGPHVSFTKHEYVKDIFRKSVNGLFFEKEVKVGNYYRGNWVTHPVQTNLYQIPEPLRSVCVDSFLKKTVGINIDKIQNYKEWLTASLGDAITNNFVAPYTRKYWTVEPEELSIDWIASRVYKPKIKDVVEGAKGKLHKKIHYINKIRYPHCGGFESFGEYLHKGANIMRDSEAVHIDLDKKNVKCKDGSLYSYQKLISTIPLPEFVKIIKNSSPELVDAAEQLSCTQLLLINVEVDETSNKLEDWFYIYDEDKFCTRITFTEKLSKNNAPKGKSGIQVEVYFSKYKPYENNVEFIKEKVVDELLEMGVIEREESAKNSKVNHRWVKYANIIFDHKRKEALNYIFDRLSPFGLSRKDDDLHALTDWSKTTYLQKGSFYLLGRHGEWKYYWSDDCILSGKKLADNLLSDI